MKTILLTLITCILFSLPAIAQNDDVQNIDIRLRPNRSFTETALAVEDFTAFEGTKLLKADSIIMIRMAEVIRNDLAFSPFYKIVEFDSLYMRHMELEIMTLLGWNQLGAEYVIKGEGEFRRNEITFRYKLYSAVTGRIFARGKFRSPVNNYRRLAHTVANDIIYYLTGEKGIFDTRVCFISKRTGNKELFLCDYDGANIYQLTNNKSINLSPCFDPEGRKVLFTSYMHDDPQLYQYDLVSGDIDQLAAYPGINSAARVSPDGKYIVAALSRDGNAELYLLYRDGKIKRRLTYTNSIESSPCWSPTGKEIAFTSDRTGSPQLYIMDIDGVNVRRLSYQGSYNDSPDWAPKGDEIVYLSRVNGRFNICTIDITGINHKVLTNRGNNENPHWSPDGNHIIFSSTRTGTKEIYIMDRFGFKEKRLSTGGGNSNPAWTGYIR
ncbi:MAG: Tol-Pal system beta propeller repeat protein TolB [candidate division Zixibacteria bacterium]|nr:Tol-Pal system beta propeller repeat protein TolB [candidate division Zixibacteria bacterium]